MIPNIEAVLGIGENNDNKIKKALAYFKSKKAEEIPVEIMNPLKRIMELVGT